MNCCRCSMGCSRAVGGRAAVPRAAPDGRARVRHRYPAPYAQFTEVDERGRGGRSERRTRCARRTINAVLYDDAVVDAVIRCSSGGGMRRSSYMDRGGSTMCVRSRAMAMSRACGSWDIPLRILAVGSVQARASGGRRASAARRTGLAQAMR